MNKLTTTALSAITGLTIATASFTSTAAMNPAFENQLISVCKAAKSDKVMYLKDRIERINTDYKTIALKLVCNNQNVIEFAESYGANKTAQKLTNSLGTATITDLANKTEFRVHFDG